MIKLNETRENIRENIKEHNPNCPQIPDYPNNILIIGGSGSAGKSTS